MFFHRQDRHILITFTKKYQIRLYPIFGSQNQIQFVIRLLTPFCNSKRSTFINHCFPVAKTKFFWSHSYKSRIFNYTQHLDRECRSLFISGYYITNIIESSDCDDRVHHREIRYRLKAAMIDFKEIQKRLIELLETQWLKFCVNPRINFCI